MFNEDITEINIFYNIDKKNINIKSSNVFLGLNS